MKRESPGQRTRRKYRQNASSGGGGVWEGAQSRREVERALVSQSEEQGAQSAGQTSPAGQEVTNQRERLRPAPSSSAGRGSGESRCGAGRRPAGVGLRRVLILFLKTRENEYVKC